MRGTGQGRGRSRATRGATLVEVLLTSVVLLGGVAAAGSVVVHTVRQGRRNLAQAQVQALAERELEAVVARGCRATGTDPCEALKALPRTERRFRWNANGVPTELEGEPAEGERVYRVEVDVDPPYEDGERGVPAVERLLVPGGRAPHLVNVRVTVRWDDPERGPLAAAVQTRVSPDLPAPPVAGPPAVAAGAP